MSEDFSLRNPRIRLWISGVVAVGIALVLASPPAFWLCGVGVPLLLLGQVANSWRTNQWMSWQNEGSLNWFEGSLVSTGVVLTVVPLLGALLRAWLG